MADSTLYQLAYGSSGLGRVYEVIWKDPLKEVPFPKSLLGNLLRDLGALGWDFGGVLILDGLVGLPKEEIC